MKELENNINTFLNKRLSIVKVGQNCINWNYYYSIFSLLGIWFYIQL